MLASSCVASIIERTTYRVGEKVPGSSNIMAEPSKKKAKQAINVNTEKERLLSIWKLVTKKMRSKVKNGDAATVEFLAECLPADEYPSKDSGEPSHCVFCHKDFDPRLPDACSTEHDLDDCFKTGFAPDVYTYSCGRCEHSQEEAEYGGDYTVGYCRKDVCCEDIEERIDHEWRGDEEESRQSGRFDGCKVCVAKVIGEKKAAEAIVIDD